MKQYGLSVLGGTFDILHEGHKEFITYALRHSENLIIGLTSQEYVKNHKPQILHNFEERKKQLQIFLTDRKIIDKVTILPIDDPFGITLDPQYPLDAIFVTDETRIGAEKINERRENLGLKKLIIQEFKIIKKFLSSTDIRKGNVNRLGRTYIQKEWFEKLLLPNEKRNYLQKPFGKIITDFPNWIKSNSLVHVYCITVGDETTERFLHSKVYPNLSIVDLYIQRKKRHETLSEFGFEKGRRMYIAKNDPGTLDPSLFQVLKMHFLSDGKSVILVKGEEDLSVIPVILFAPLNALVFYGQPGEGMVYVKVTEKIKEEMYNLTSEFTKAT